MANTDLRNVRTTEPRLLTLIVPPRGRRFLAVHVPAMLRSEIDVARARGDAAVVGLLEAVAEVVATHELQRVQDFGMTLHMGLADDGEELRRVSTEPDHDRDGGSVFLLDRKFHGIE